MTVIAVQPHVLKDMVLTIGLDDYEGHLSSCALVPSTDTPVLRWQGLTPAASFSESGSPTTSWVWNINAAQDWETANSLSQYLFDHAGEVVTVELSPQRGKGKTFTFECTVVPGQIGGDVNTVAEAAVSMPVDGTPVMSTFV